MNHSDEKASNQEHPATPGAKVSFVLFVAIFPGAYFVPFNSPRVGRSILEGFYMVQEYAQAHVLFCLIPAFIAGAIANFISQGTVVRRHLPAGGGDWTDDGFSLLGPGHYCARYHFD